MMASDCGTGGVRTTALDLTSTSTSAFSPANVFGMLIMFDAMHAGRNSPMMVPASSPRWRHHFNRAGSSSDTREKALPGRNEIADV